MNLPPEPQDPRPSLTHGDRRLGGPAQHAHASALSGFRRRAGRQGRRLQLAGPPRMVPTQDRLFVTPGAHAALVGILSLLSSPGDVLLCEAVTYPGIRSIAAQKGLRLVGLAMDRDGILPDAFRAACRTLEPKALYLNPTLHNPTTMTIPRAAGPRSRGWRASSAFRSWRTTPTGSCRTTESRPSPPSPRTSPGISRVWRNASGRDCAWPMSSPRTRAPHGPSSRPWRPPTSWPPR